VDINPPPAYGVSRALWRAVYEPETFCSSTRISSRLRRFAVLLVALYMPPLAQTVRPQPGSSAPSADTAPEQNPVTTFADAIRVLGHERSVAEAYGMLLDTHGKKDMSRYVEGIRLYSEAKADFDGLLWRGVQRLSASNQP
jgi:hypothetical protein